MSTYMKTDAKAEKWGRKKLKPVDDRITLLPDNILHEILSLLPTIEAVRLSVLSTKWRYLWISLPCLYISEDRFLNCKKHMAIDNMIYRFRAFVGKILALHDQSNIRKFHLRCTGRYNASRLEGWIYSVIAVNRLEELSLEVSSSYCFRFPCSLDHFSTLITLKIHMFTILHVPILTCLSRLRVLHLASIRFSSGQSTANVSLSFPVLEECMMTYCYWLETQNVYLQAPLLKRLKIVDPMFPVDFSEIEINVDAKNLVSLVFCNLVHNYSISAMPSLADASLDVVCGSDAHRLMNYITKIRNVRDLAISYRCIETLFYAGTLCVSQTLHGFQTFSKLTHLKVTTARSYFRRTAIINLLVHMPNIECLIIDDYCDFSNDDAGSVYPPCLLSKLKYVEIKYLIGTASELRFVAYLLARTLEKMTIITYKCLERREGGHDILELLKILPRG